MIGIIPLHLQKQVMIFLVADAQDYDLAMLIHNPLKSAGEDVKALLVGQTRDQADDRRLFFLRQAVVLLQFDLVPDLERKRRRAEALGNILVGRRVPDVVVDAVDNAENVGRAGAQQPVQTVAKFLCLDLLRVSF